MSRIVIIGPPGAGKTEFANNLGRVLGIKEVNHLDHFFWKPGWVRTTGEERHEAISHLILKNEWIIEGNFLETVDTQFSRADVVIWLNLSAFICLYRVLRRYFEKERPEIAPGCRDKITPQFLFSIFFYKLFDTYFIKQKIKKNPFIHLVVLKNPKQVFSYFEKVKHTHSLL